jgi:hypothetical protein
MERNGCADIGLLQSQECQIRHCFCMLLLLSRLSTPWFLNFDFGYFGFKTFRSALFQGVGKES